MRRLSFLGIVAVLVVVCVGPTTLANSSGSSITCDFDRMAGHGFVTINASPGQEYTVYDWSGAFIAHGATHSPYTTQDCGPVATGPNGTAVIVAIDGEMIAVTDPDWEWN